MEENAKRVAELLKILANPHRLIILCSLEKGEMTVSELCKCISNIGMSALSQHLSVLKSHGFIENDKRGQNVFYHIQDERVHQILRVLRDTYGSRP